MNAYKKYFDDITPPPELRAKLLSGEKPAQPARPTLRRYVPAIACGAICLAAIFTVPQFFRSEPAIEKVPSETAVDAAPKAPEDAPKEYMEIINSYSDGGPQESACYKSPDPGETLLFAEVAAAVERNPDAVFFVAVDIIGENGVAPEEDVAAETDRLRALGYKIGYSEAWTYQGAGEKVPVTFLSALLSADELKNFAASEKYGYAFRFPTNGDSSPAEPDMAVFGLPADMTAAETYDVPQLGHYVLEPEMVPDGFVLENSTGVSDSVHGTTEIFAVWTRGYDYIDWRTEFVAEEDKARLVSAAETDKYDVSLYPPPRADTVPEELRATVEDPVFAIEELTAEVVARRAGTGDEGKVTLRFSVLYGDVLVSVTSKGVSPSEMYEMLYNLK